MRSLLFSLLIVGSYAFTLPAMAWKTEAVSFTTHNTFNNSSWQNISFRQSYTTTPIVITAPSTQGSDPAITRVRNVSTSGFEVNPVEPFARDGPHVAMSSAYIAIEAGVHVFPDGTVIEAGFVNTNKTQQASNVGGVSGWENVNLQHNFGSPPTIVAAIQTMNNETGENGSQAPSVSSLPWLTVAIDNISANSFDVALERSESSQGSVTQDELIGYIAIAQGDSGSFTDSQNLSVQYLGDTSSTNIRGWSDGDTTHTFSTAFSSAPLSVFVKNTRNNPDGGWLRRNGNTTTTAINLRVDEDTDNDSERGITTANAEAAGIFGFSRAFDADFPPNFTMQKSSSVISDPLNHTTNPKAIPGAVIEYTLVVTNTGFDFTDSNQFEISDALPPDTALIVSDIPGGIGPIGFTDGATSSQTTWSFAGLSSLTDSISFSSDGSDFSYVPTVGGDGTDASVTHIKLKPQGSFAANPLSNPSAVYTYRVVIQ